MGAVEESAGGEVPQHLGGVRDLCKGEGEGEERRGVGEEGEGEREGEEGEGRRGGGGREIYESTILINIRCDVLFVCLFFR